MGARSVLASLTTDALSAVRWESAAEVTEAKDDLRAGAADEACESLEGDVSEAEATGVEVGRVLMKREDRRLLGNAPSPSLSLVANPEAMEAASSPAALRSGLEMLDREMGLRSEGLVMEKLLGGAAPRIDLRGLGGMPARLTDVLVLDAWGAGFDGVNAVCVELDIWEASESWDVLRCSGSETRLAVDPICWSWAAGERRLRKRVWKVLGARA
jgi:hypothetical protein